MRSVFSDEGYVKSSENNTSLSSYLAEWIYVLCHLVGFSDLLQGQFNCSFMVIKRMNVLFSRRERVIQKGDFSFLSSFFFSLFFSSFLFVKQRERYSDNEMRPRVIHIGKEIPRNAESQRFIKINDIYTGRLDETKKFETLSILVSVRTTCAFLRN